MNRQAFTLIEALAAILLMALILPTALTGVSQALRASGNIQRRHVALELAENQMTYLVSSGTWDVSAQSGSFDVKTFGELAVDYKWAIELNTWRDPNVKELRVTVSWDTDELHAVSLTTLVMPEVLL